MELCLDIETVIDPKTTYLIPEPKKKKKDDDSDGVGKYRFDSNFNRICVINTFNGKEHKTFFNAEHEEVCLNDFWNYLRDYRRFITFNGLTFDIPHIYKRSWVNQIKPTVFISLAKYRIDNHLDIRAILSNWDNYSFGTLDFYYNRLSNSKQIVELFDGSDVQMLWETKKYDLIVEHCKSDCEKLWQIYQSMIGYYPGV